jgi:hypothetical protein
MINIEEKILVRNVLNTVAQIVVIDACHLTIQKSQTTLFAFLKYLSCFMSAVLDFSGFL